MKKLIATAVMGAVIALTPLSASAQYRSYYDMMSGWNQTSQVNFAKSMVRSYERTNQIYENFLTRYTRFKQYSWYQRMQSRYNFQVAEVAKFSVSLFLAFRDMRLQLEDIDILTAYCPWV